MPFFSTLENFITQNAVHKMLYAIDIIGVDNFLSNMLHELL